MTTRSDLETELIAQLQVSANSSLFPSARVTTLIQNAYLWVTGMYVWPVLVRAKCASTVANATYYDYPDEFRPESIIRLEIDGLEYNRKDYEDFKDYKNRYPTSSRRIFANFGRYYFINPAYPTAGSDNLDIWGAIQADALSATDTESIFSGNLESVNEDVVNKALSVGLKRIDPNQSKELYDITLMSLGKINSDIWDAKQREQRLQHPKFYVPDFFGSGINSRIGSFDYDPQQEIY